MDKAPVKANNQVTVYFDGSCPLCRREIGFYKNSVGADLIHWEDVSRVSDGRVAGDLSCQQAMARFHVRAANGSLKSGAAAFVELWLSLKYWHWLGWLFAHPLGIWFLEKCYVGFLRIRPAIQRRIK
jgi:predicted DCC family thiol-disulfide oxidoreductase YuxK